MQEKTLATYLGESAALIEATIPHLADATMDRAVALCVKALRNGKAMLVCGNGGSAADAMHIAGELVARFLIERKGLRCICLSENPAMMTAWANDYDYASVFARQVEAFGEPGGVLLGISTSGNSENVLRAFDKAKAMGMNVIALTGQGGGKMAPLADVLLDVPSRITPMIQQVHICLYHFLCAKIEAAMAAEVTE
jgi:D-sedoheptulose 7-phosphate isomerase